MRQPIAALALLALAGSAEAAGTDDPHLYDANGTVVTPAPAFAAVPPAPECRDSERTVIIGGAPQKAWAGKPENVAAAQRAFLHRAKMNSLATLGKWKVDLEKKAA